MIVTIDGVLKLRSEYETNQYTIEELLETMSLLLGCKTESIENSTLSNVKNLTLHMSEHLQSLTLPLKALDENAMTVESSTHSRVL